MILQFGFSIEVVHLHTCDLTSKIFNYSFTMFIKDMHAAYIFFGLVSDLDTGTRGIVWDHLPSTAIICRSWLFEWLGRTCLCCVSFTNSDSLSSLVFRFLYALVNFWAKYSHLLYMHLSMYKPLAGPKVLTFAELSIWAAWPNEPSLKNGPNY